MKEISFYEVINGRNSWAAIYSPLLDERINVGTDAFSMARITAKRCEGQIFSVSPEGERELIWPK